MTLGSVSTDHLRQVLAEVDDAAATERLMAALAYKEVDEVTQEGAAELYEYSEGWASKWFNRLERLADEPFEEVVYGEPRQGDRPDSPSRNTSNSSKIHRLNCVTFQGVHQS